MIITNNNITALSDGGWGGLNHQFGVGSGAGTTLESLSVMTAAMPDKAQSLQFYTLGLGFLGLAVLLFVVAKLLKNLDWDVEEEEEEEVKVEVKAEVEEEVEVEDIHPATANRIMNESPFAASADTVEFGIRGGRRYALNLPGSVGVWERHYASTSKGKDLSTARKVLFREENEFIPRNDTAEESDALSIEENKERRRVFAITVEKRKEVFEDLVKERNRDRMAVSCLTDEQMVKVRKEVDRFMQPFMKTKMEAPLPLEPPSTDWMSFWSFEWLSLPMSSVGWLWQHVFVEPWLAVFALVKLAWCLPVMVSSADGGNSKTCMPLWSVGWRLLLWSWWKWKLRWHGNYVRWSRLFRNGVKLGCLYVGVGIVRWSWRCSQWWLDGLVVDVEG